MSFALTPHSPDTTVNGSALGSILTLGLNHQTAPVALREQVAFPTERIVSALGDLTGRFKGWLGEGAILSTCNRTELYLAGNQALENPDQIKRELAHWLATQHGVAPDQLASHLYLRTRTDAVRHAFRVASGLDSMVLGEPQILGQMKDAARVAQSANTLGTQLHQVFQRSFAVAKEVRTSTEIGTQSVSLAAAGVRLAERVFGELRESKVLFIGAGEMIELCATHFAAKQPKQMCIANRTPERAQKLAQRFNAQTLSFAEVAQQLANFDVVVSCTASTLPIIGLGLVERALKARRRRPMVMIDLAVPRDIEPEAGHLTDVYLYTVDDLGRLVSTNMAARQAAVAQAEVIIENQVLSFEGWLLARQSVPLAKQITQRGNAVADLELQKAQRALARGDDPQEVLAQLAHSLTAKFLHGPLDIARQTDNPQAVCDLLDRVLPRPPQNNS